MRPNTVKITRDLLRGNTLLFFPANECEAGFIQQQLLDMGCIWKNGETSIAHAVACVSTGMCVFNGRIYTTPSGTSLQKGLLCRSDQFETPFLTPEMTFLMEQFDKVNKRLAAIEEQLSPRTLDKPSLKGIKP